MFEEHLARIERSSTGEITNEYWKQLVDGGILAATLNRPHQSPNYEEILKTVRKLSYDNLSLGLTYGIMTGLVILPLQRFSRSETQLNKYLDKIRNGQRFGLAITEEKKSGSTALDMDSEYQYLPDGRVKLKFSKHLQGLSGKNGLLVAANKKSAGVKTIGLFIVDQKDMVTKVTPMIGLHGIQYGINTGDLILDSNEQLVTEFPRRELTTFQDIFTRSRFLFIGTMFGHLERMNYEANIHASTREIGNGHLKDLPVVAYKLQQMQVRRDIVGSMYQTVVRFMNDPQSLDTTKYVAQADIIKSLSTEYALLVAADRAELVGGAAFYQGNALQDFINAWPFKIFEGSGWFLASQIGHSALKKDILTSNAFFDSATILSRLDQETLGLLSLVKEGEKTKLQDFFYGQIVARCFALGCLNPLSLSSSQMQQAEILLNFEINTIAREYLATKKSDLEVK